MSYKVTVIGAVNIDICGKPFERFIPKDSNIGSVSHTIGGVGFNVARDLSLLGAEVRFVAALGDDVYSAEIENEANRFSIDMTMCKIFSGERNSVYLYVTDEHGDMLAAVNDMRINRHLNKEFFEPLIDEISKNDAVVIDANLESETLLYLCENITAPIFADAVSANKVTRLEACLPYLTLFKPNAIEAGVLCGFEVNDYESAERAAEYLVDKIGVGKVFITMGAKGTVAYDGEMAIIKAPISGGIVNTAGAGDAFFSCCVMAALEKKSLEESCSFALRGAKCACQGEQAVNINLKLLSEKE